MSKANFILGIIMLSAVCHAEDETLDVEFLEWLGQVAEVEELGVDVNGLLDAQEQQPQSANDEENSK